MRYLLSGLLLLAVALPGVAGERKVSRWWDTVCPWRLPLSLCCPDDYCRKPPPCLSPEFCPKGCDDYCRKPPPCLSPEFCPRGCDDYCRKPPPCLPCDLPWMKCHPAERSTPR